MIRPLRSETRSRYVRDLSERGFPVVFVAEDADAPAIVPDSEGGIRQAVDHLARHGHRRIAFVAGPQLEEEGDSARRLAAYRQAVRELDLDVDEGLVVYGSYNRTLSFAATQGLLDTGVAFTALLASNDEGAFGAMQALRERGLRIPEDVAVVGFDDQLAARAQEPPLTTILSPTFEIGYRALEMLMEHVAGRLESSEIVRIPVRLITRQSCGCLPGDAAPVLGEPDGVVQEMADAVLAQDHHLGGEEVGSLCRQLVDALTSSLDGGDALPFRLALEEVLRRVEAAEGDLHAWQAALTALERGLSTSARAGDLLRRARIAVSEGVRRQHTRYLVRQANVADHLGFLAAQLLQAFDEREILQVLEGHLARLGIRGAHVAFFEPEEDDPVAWSLFDPSAGAGGEAVRFPSREFPPDGLYAGGESFSLALLPLTIGEERVGFVVFDTADLGPCAAIVRQLAGAIRSARLYREAVEARRLAEEANRLKSRFLSMVSHELRTPLNVVLGLSGLLLQEEGEEGLSASQRGHVEQITSSAGHLDALIRDVIDLSCSEVGQLRLVCEPLDLAEVLAPVSAVGQQLAGNKGLRWSCDIPPDLPRIRGDRTRLRQVALNLVSNAVKFTAKGGVTLEVRVRQISDCGSQVANRESPVADRLSRVANRQSPISDGQLLTTDGNALRDKRLAISDQPVVFISVSDTGLGIPPAEQTTIFDEFRQGERTSARGYGGLGLGLAVCRLLVEMHGGRIWAESSGEEGAGSTFTFTLPVLEADEGERGRGEGEREKEGAVLVLAERIDDMDPLSAHLVRQGFAVETTCIDEGSDWLSSVLAAPPPAVVLDLGLAAARGWEILKALKESPATRDVPVLFASLEEQDGGAVLEMDYLTKPIGTSDLAQALDRQGIEAEDGKTILVVDDEVGVREVHARVVRAQLPGCRVLEAGDGREALEVIRAEQPDLVLLDLMMPEMDGFGVLEAMQEGETTRTIPVIVLTGRALTEDDVRRLNRGVTAVLGKGLFTVEETLVHVTRALRRDERTGSETQQIVRRALAYVHQHYAEPISPETLAAHVGVSKRHLSRCFRQEMDLSPGAYLNRYRVRQACMLLETGDETITEVGLAVGFSDGHYFGRVFRREVGVSPSAYRRGERAKDIG